MSNFTVMTDDQLAAHDASTSKRYQAAAQEAQATIAKQATRIAALEQDAARYRWLRDQHEGLVLNGLDADGVMLPATVREIGFSVFMPDRWGGEAIVPVPIGDLDETIDAAIEKGVSNG